MRKYHNFSSENSFYSREQLQYITYACFCNIMFNLQAVVERYGTIIQKLFAKAVAVATSAVGKSMVPVTVFVIAAVSHSAKPASKN